MSKTRLITSFLFILIWFFQTLVAQVPSIEEAEEKIKHNFPVVVGSSWPEVLPTASLWNNRTKSNINSLTSSDIIRISDNGKEARMSMGVRGKDYVFGPAQEGRIVIAGAYATFVSVKEVTIHPVKNATYIVKCELLTLENVGYSEDKFRLGHDLYEIEFTESTSGWVFSPGAESTGFYKRAIDIGYGRILMEKQQFHQSIPEVVVEKWVDNGSNKPDRETYFFDKEEGTFWHFGPKDPDTTRGRYSAFTYNFGFLSGYRLTTEAGETIIIHFDTPMLIALKERGRIRFEIQDGSFKTGNFYKIETPKYVVSPADQEQIDRLRKKLVGRWEGKKDFFLEFQEDGTMSCFLPEKAVNNHRTPKSQLSGKEYNWAGSYWILPHFKEGMRGGYCIVIGTEPGDMTSDNEMWFWVYGTTALYNTLKGYMFVGSYEFEKK